MKYILFISALLIGFASNAQDTLAPDQNPNYKKSLARYDSTFTEYTLLQGTTFQDTYEAIDPMEQRRKLREMRREFRAKRPLWRHQRRMERARNPGWNGWNNGWNNWGWNRWNNNWGWNNWGYRNRWNRSNFWTGAALGLGLGAWRWW